MIINKKSIRATIKATQEWLDSQTNREKYSEWGGLTIFGCETRNLREYKTMLNSNYKTTKDYNDRQNDLYNCLS